jgi:predicted TIM-barrel fold metal-dependent hydrolase
MVRRSWGTSDEEARAVARQRRFEILDAHIHPVTAKWNAFGWYLPFDSQAAMVAELRKAGIGRACGAVVSKRPSADFSSTAACNRAAMAFYVRFPDFYIPSVQANPRFPDESCRAIERLHARGARWIGELTGYASGYGEEYDTDGAFQIYDLAQRLGMAVNFHGSDLDQARRMCRAFPGLPFVLAHPGGGRDVYDGRVRLAAETPNLYLDLSGTGITRWGMIRHGVDIAGAHKLLFGTDFPVCTPSSFVACVLSEPLTDAERAAIFAGNAKRLLGLV